MIPFCTIGEAMDTNSIDSTRSTKAETFKRVAEKRTRRVCDSLRLLGQCSNQRSYEYTDDQVTKIFKEIRSALRHAEQSFKNNKKDMHFKL